MLLSHWEFREIIIMIFLCVSYLLVCFGLWSETELLRLAGNWTQRINTVGMIAALFYPDQCWDLWILRILFSEKICSQSLTSVLQGHGQADTRLWELLREAEIGLLSCLSVVCILVFWFLETSLFGLFIYKSRIPNNSQHIFHSSS